HSCSSVAQKKSGGHFRSRRFHLRKYSQLLPDELEAHLDVAGQHVLGRHGRRDDATEVGAPRGRADVVAAVVVVVHQVEGLEAELDSSALTDAGGLKERGVQLNGVVDADLTGAVGK